MIYPELRKFEEKDVEQLALHANNLKIAQYMTDLFPHPYTEENASHFIQMATSHEPTKVFAISLEGNLIGAIGIHPQTGIMRLNAELGYWLAEDYWGKGFMTRMVSQMVKYGFSTFDITRIFARPFGSNIGSSKVLEKSGFELEATIKGNIIKFDMIEDEKIYAIRKDNIVNT